MAQLYSSKNTSVNTTKLPAIYNKIHWRRYMGHKVVDYGCGQKKTQNLIKKYLSQFDIEYLPYDPYNCTQEENEKAIFELQNGNVSCIICSNVLNVIYEDEIVDDIIERLNRFTCRYNKYVLSFRCAVYVSVYEGNKTGIGKRSKKDCWQRNEKKESYLKRFNDHLFPPFDNTQLFTIKNGIITNWHYGVK